MISRLESRCIATSAIVHGALGVLLLIAPAFRQPRQDLLGAGEPLLLIPGELVDAALAPGPAPAAAGAPAAARVPPPSVPRPSGVSEANPPPEAESQAEPPSPSDERVDLPVTDAPVFKLPSSQARERPPAKAKRPDREAPRIDLSQAKPVKSSTPTPRERVETDKDAEAAAARARRQELARSLASAAGSLEGTAKAGSIRIQLSSGGGGGGGGGGGSSYALYVQTAYHNAWTAPQNVRDELATVDVEVVIRRDGRVARARIVKKSGIAALDRSVQAAIDRVTEVRPFEAGTTDAERSFSIGFNLRGKRGY